MIRLNEEGLGCKVSTQDIERSLAEHPSLMESCWAGAPHGTDWLGWLSVDQWAGPQELARIHALADRLRKKTDTLVLIGVGGSNNAARSVLSALGPADPCHRVVYAGNTLSAWTLRKLLESLEGHEVALFCVAKNFRTLEPGSSFRLLRQHLVSQLGKRAAAERIVCNGTPGSDLERLCSDEGYTFTTFPPNIGGRYTALTATHLLPLAYAGIDIDALVKGARAEESELRRLPDHANPALRYAHLRSLAGRSGLTIELLASFEPRLADFGLWWQQLFGESEGKQGRGLFPACARYSEELHSLGQYVQDGTHQLMETFLDIAEPGPDDHLVLGTSDVADGFGYLDGADFWDINKTSFRAVLKAHASVLPCATIEIGRLDEQHMGALFYFFMLSCYCSAELLGVDPFDQPGVEAYKQLIHHALGRVE